MKLTPGSSPQNPTGWLSKRPDRAEVMERKQYLYRKRIIRQTEEDETPEGKMSFVCWRKEKKISHYTTISHFTQTLYLDYRHYVPIKHKRKVWHFKLFRESAYRLSGKKTKGKIKIYYHLLKILLKINKTNTNKTQQKSPTLSLSLYISLSISLSLAWLGDSLRRRKLRELICI